MGHQMGQPNPIHENIIMSYYELECAFALLKMVCDMRVISRFFLQNKRVNLRKISSS